MGPQSRRSVSAMGSPLQVPSRLSSLRDGRFDDMTCPPLRPRRGSDASTRSAPNFSRRRPSTSAGTSRLPAITIPPNTFQDAAPLFTTRQMSGTVATLPKHLPVKRWDGQACKGEPWDQLKRDPELLIEGADCAIHFSAKGQSRRGPSLLVPLDKVEASGCLPYLRIACIDTALDSPASDSGYSTASSEGTFYNLHLAAPAFVARDELRDWHLTTRNVFAWIMDKPLVGQSLSRALIGLLERLLTLRPATLDSVSDVIAYAGRMGYINMTNHFDHALAMLNFAEHFRIRSLWTEAFVHCAGQSERLYLSPEFASVSKKTQGSITKAYLRMDLKVANVWRRLGNFLEEDVSPSILGLSRAQRTHLDRFRSFLHSYYVAKLGYWPPNEFTKPLLAEMHDEMQTLYDLLADKSSPGARPTSGGLCVLQNVGAFDASYGYEKRDYTVPLTPKNGHQTGKSLQVKSYRIAVSTKAKRRERLLSAWAELLDATNELPAYGRDSMIVQSYLSFEQQSLVLLENDLSMSEARKVRWIQIYYLVQALRSIMPASCVPSAEAADYHTCAAVPEIPWSSSNKMSFLAVHPILRSPVDSEPRTPPFHTPVEERSSSAFSIHPDCEDDDYFAPKVLPRRDSNIFTSSPILSRAGSIFHLPRSSSSTSLQARGSKRFSSTFQLPAIQPLTYTPSGSLPPTPDESFLEVFELPDSGARTPTLQTKDIPLGPFELEAAENMLYPPSLRDNASILDDECEVDMHGLLTWDLTKADFATHTTSSWSDTDSDAGSDTSDDEDSAYSPVSSAILGSSPRNSAGSVKSLRHIGGLNITMSGPEHSVGDEDAHFSSDQESLDTEEAGRGIGRKPLTPVLEIEMEGYFEREAKRNANRKGLDAMVRDGDSPGSAREWADVYSVCLEEEEDYFGSVVSWVDVPRVGARG